MLLEFKQPIPVITPHGEGYAIYVSESGNLDNDCFCVASCEDGQLRHYSTMQVKISPNNTFGINIKKHEPNS